MDLRQIKNLMKEFEDSKIHKLEITENDFTIKLEKEENKVFSNTPVITAQQPLVSSTPVVESAERVVEEVNDNTPVSAPLVGTFYQAPSPDSDPFVRVGSKVSKGDTLFIIEAMKVMNEITAPVSGEVVKINVNDGTMVEFGQTVLEIKE